MMYNKNKGNVSILIIVIISMVLFFGLFLYSKISTTEKISEISYGWFEQKNKINNESVEAIYLIENALFEAEEKALNYIYNQDYLKEDVSSMPLIIHQVIKEEFLTTENKLLAYENLLHNLYYFYANARLESLVNYVPSLKVYQLNDGAFVKSISLNMIFYGEDANNFLNVDINVDNPTYSVELDENGTVTFIKDFDKKQYNIVTHKLYRKIIYEEGE